MTLACILLCLAILLEGCARLLERISHDEDALILQCYGEEERQYDLDTAAIASDALRRKPRMIIRTRVHLGVPGPDLAPHIVEIAHN